MKGIKMFGYILLAIAMITMTAVIGGAVIYMAPEDEIINLEMNDRGEFVEAVLVVK